jgi:hypothetical protein
LLARAAAGGLTWSSLTRAVDRSWRRAAEHRRLRPRLERTSNQGPTDPIAEGIGAGALGPVCRAHEEAKDQLHRGALWCPARERGLARRRPLQRSAV